MQPCTLSSQGGSHTALVLGWKSTHCPIIFICEVVRLLLHAFSKHLGNPLGGIPLSPSSSLVLRFSQGHLGLGSYGVCACFCMDVPLVMCKRMGSIRQSTVSLF